MKGKHKPAQEEGQIQETILVICAHNDDNVIGAGGTIAKYVKSGKNVITIIFSYGEKGIPWLKEIESIKTRVKEAKSADKILGIDKTYFFGLKEGSFVEEAKKKGIVEKLGRFIKITKPEKIFTHSMDDPHPDHMAVTKIVIETVEKLNYSCDIYSFDVWNPFNIRKRMMPKLVVDITKTMKYKLRAFRRHKSQKLVQWIMVPAIYARAIANGIENGTRYAEVFIKIK